MAKESPTRRKVSPRSQGPSQSGSKRWTAVPPAKRPPAAGPPAQPVHRDGARSSKGKSAAGSQPFHPATGEWLKPPPPAADSAADPIATRSDLLAKFLRVLLWIDVLAIAALLLSNIYGGAILFFTPESAQAQQLREQMEGGSAADTYVNVGLSFLLFGIIPFAWLLGTRRPSWRGTREYLHLRAERRDWLRGIALAPALVVLVAILSAVYLVATQGIDGLQQGEDDAPVNALFGHLTWPLVGFITLASGIGEEIYFRGILRRWIGIWPQAIAFGLAHAAGAYPPQILFAMAIGVLFGYLLRRGWSLVTMMVAHAGYNLTLLSLAMLFPELA